MVIEFSTETFPATETRLASIAYYAKHASNGAILASAKCPEMALCHVLESVRNAFTQIKQHEMAEAVSQAIGEIEDLLDAPRR